MYTHMTLLHAYLGLAGLANGRVHDEDGAVGLDCVRHLQHLLKQAVLLLVAPATHRQESSLRGQA